MNVKAFLFSALLAIGATACSSDDEPAIDEPLMESISRGDRPLCYELTEVKEYHDFGNGWECFDPTGWYGGGSTAPGTIIIQNGRILTQQSLFSEVSGPHPVFDILQAYKKSTRSTFEVYLSSPFEYDKKNGTMMIEGQKYHITGFSEKAMYAHVFGHGKNHENNEFKIREDLTYVSAKYNVVDLEKNLVGTSMDEIYRKAIAMCREHFGSKIDLTEVYDGDVILDAGNIIDLDELERELGL